MNRILLPPREGLEEPQPTMGSGRYYAQLSQSESFRGQDFSESRFVWLLEAFDARWFDEQGETPPGRDFGRFYEEAELFVLELRLPASELGRFAELDSLAKAEDDGSEPDDWISIEVHSLEGGALGEDELGVVVYSNLYVPGIPASVAEVQYADSTTAERLRRTVNIDHIPDATETDVDDALGNVKPIAWIVALDVGQGNAIGLCNAVGAIEVYSDLGGGVLANAFTFPAALRNFCFTGNPPIILSHWDFDHWSSGPRDPNSLRQTWIAPRQPVGPTHVAFMATIMVAKGRVLLLPSTFPAKWRGQLHLERCTGRGRNHSGLALTVSQRLGGVGHLMLFPGDARYPVVPSFKPTRYLSVVAPHHGADMRNKTVPVSPRQSPSRLVYSYGHNNTFSHPRPVTRGNHHAAGWTDRTIAPAHPNREVYETAHRSQAMLGHVFLSWTQTSTLPPLACHGTRCQLQAQQ